MKVKMVYFMNPIKALDGAGARDTYRALSPDQEHSTPVDCDAIELVVDPMSGFPGVLVTKGAATRLVSMANVRDLEVVRWGEDEENSDDEARGDRNADGRIFGQ